MRLYRFWTSTDAVFPGRRGDFTVTAYGYSNESLDDALRVARERAEATGRWILAGKRPGREYYGSERPLREESIEEIEHDGRRLAVLTRNSYGSLVLNTDDVLFADVDIPNRGLSTLFTSRRTLERRVVDRITRYAENDRAIRLRLYRTTKGFRILLLSELIPASDPRSSRLLERLGSDSLYLALCRTHDSYRARLTPKHWRIGYPKPPARFPFRSGAEERAYRAWVDGYTRASRGFATCAFVAELGAGRPHPAARAVMAVHDRWALNGDRPLA